MTPSNIRLVASFYTSFERPLLQTKNQILFSLYGITVGSFMWNIGEMMGMDNKYSYFLTVVAMYIEAFCHMELVSSQVRLGMVPSKIIINPYHMFLITFFFCITAQWIYPFATWYNWIIHFYTCLLAIETSITTTTQEFVPGEFPEEISLLPNRISREPWKKWKYL